MMLGNAGQDLIQQLAGQAAGARHAAPPSGASSSPRTCRRRRSDRSPTASSNAFVKRFAVTQGTSSSAAHPVRHRRGDRRCRQPPAGPPDRATRRARRSGRRPPTFPDAGCESKPPKTPRAPRQPRLPRRSERQLRDPAAAAERARPTAGRLSPRSAADPLRRRRRRTDRDSLDARSPTWIARVPIPLARAAARPRRGSAAVAAPGVVSPKCRSAQYARVARARLVEHAPRSTSASTSPASSACSHCGRTEVSALVDLGIGLTGRATMSGLPVASRS